MTDPAALAQLPSRLPQRILDRIDSIIGCGNLGPCSTCKGQRFAIKEDLDSLTTALDQHAATVRALEEANAGSEDQVHRERLAGIHCGVLREEWGDDWPEAVADAIIKAEADREAHAEALKVAQKDIGILKLSVPLEEELSDKVSEMLKYLAMEQGFTLSGIARLFMECQRRMAADWSEVGNERRQRIKAESQVAALTAEIAQMKKGNNEPDIEAYMSAFGCTYAEALVGCQPPPARSGARETERLRALAGMWRGKAASFRAGQAVLDMERDAEWLEVCADELEAALATPDPVPLAAEPRMEPKP